MKILYRKFMQVTEAGSQYVVVKIAASKRRCQETVARVSMAVVSAATLLISNLATAITAPAAGSFGYDMYDIGVNQILKGAPGFVGGTAGIVYSATLLSKNWIAAALGILACSAVLKADSITTSLGLMI